VIRTIAAHARSDRADEIEGADESDDSNPDNE
jgi:hypothetical protein